MVRELHKLESIASDNAQLVIRQSAKNFDFRVVISVISSHIYRERLPGNVCRLQDENTFFFFVKKKLHARCATTYDNVL